MVQGVLYHRSKKLDSDHTKAHCDQFATYIADKIVQICSGLDAAGDACVDDVTLSCACPIYMSTFHLVDPEDMDKIPGQMTRVLILVILG